jgi:hypothetical protein
MNRAARELKRTDNGGNRSGVDRRKLQYKFFSRKKDRAGTVENDLIAEAQ